MMHWISGLFISVFSFLLLYLVFGPHNTLLVRFSCMACVRLGWQGPSHCLLPCQYRLQFLWYAVFFNDLLHHSGNSEYNQDSSVQQTWHSRTFFSLIWSALPLCRSPNCPKCCLCWLLHELNKVFSLSRLTISITLHRNFWGVSLLCVTLLT